MKTLIELLDETPPQNTEAFLIEDKRYKEAQSIYNVLLEIHKRIHQSWPGVEENSVCPSELITVP